MISTGPNATAAQGALAASALQPAGNGSSLTGITSGQVSGLGTLMSLDTGYTANSTAGDKTIAVGAYTAAITGTMVSALNVVSTGLGTALQNLELQLIAVTKKFAAVETSLVAAKLPNA